MNNANKEQISEESKRKLLDQMKKKEEMVRLYFRKRRRYRTTLFMFAMQLATGLFLVWTTMNEPTMVTIPFLNWAVPEYWRLSAILLFNIVMYSVLTWLGIREYRKMSRSVCFHASVRGAESIAQGKMVEGAFYVVTLFRYIRQYSDAVKVKIGPWNSKIRGLFLGTIENLYESRNAIGKAVMNSQRQDSDWSNNLYKLADSLFLDEKDPDYNEALSSLRFFQEVSKKHGEPATFAQRHRRMGFALRIINEFLKATIVYILIFVLWAIFGFR